MGVGFYNLLPVPPADGMDVISRVGMDSEQAAGWNADVGEFLLDYHEVRMAEDPRAAILAFADSAYEAGTTLAGWDRELLERRPPI